MEAGVERKFRSELFRGENPWIVGASHSVGELSVLQVSAKDAPSGLALRRSFLRCFGADIDRVEFVRGLVWPELGWCPPVPADQAEQTRAPYCYERAATPLESELVALWTEILDLPRIGVLDDFWDSEGDSLDLVELTEVLGERYSATVDFFGAGGELTVRSLAELIAAARP